MLIVSFAGILLSYITGSTTYDAKAAVIIGLILARSAVLLAAETKNIPLGEGWQRVESVELRRSEYFGEHPILRVSCVLRTQVVHYFPPQDNRGDGSEDKPGEIA
jgi:hypothetical protein